jgi:hypothetical protein
MDEKRLLFYIDVPKIELDRIAVWDLDGSIPPE